VGQWQQTLTATASATGAAVVTFQGPQTRAGLRVATIDLRVTDSQAIPVCTVTINGQVQAVKRAGDRGQIIGEGDVLYNGQQLVLTWTFATPAAVCEATLAGVY
jgi:hypothetical protein